MGRSLGGGFILSDTASYRDCSGRLILQGRCTASSPEKGTGVEISFPGAGTCIPTLTPQRPPGARAVCPHKAICTLAFLGRAHDGKAREDVDLTWTPVLREISRSRVIFCRLYTSAAWSAFSLQKAHTGFSSWLIFCSRTSLHCGVSSTSPRRARCWLKPVTVPSQQLLMGY